MQNKLSQLQRDLLDAILFWTQRAENSTGQNHNRENLETIGLDYAPTDWLTKWKEPAPPSAPSISRAVARLESRGLVKRHGTTARTTQIRLTATGREVAETLAPKDKG
jgi:hypothetical protein